jgi:hypothetical protein
MISRKSAAMARRTWTLSVAATLLDGILAGVNVDRILVGLPAWHAVGTVAWANYSRSADLGSGLLLYPALAIGGALFSVGAAVCLIWQPRRRRSVAIALYVAAALALAGLLLTFKAAPFMLSLQTIRNEDVAQLQQAFNGFWFWEAIRGVIQVLAFVGNLLSLVAILLTASVDNK